MTRRLRDLGPDRCVGARRTADVDSDLNRDDARTIPTDDRYLAKKGQRHMAPDVMRPQID